MYPLFAVDDQRSFDSYTPSHSFSSFWLACVCARLFISILNKHIYKARKENPTVSSPLFAALSGKQKSQHYEINQRMSERTVLVSQMNQMLAIAFHHNFGCCCARKQFYTLFPVQSVCLQPKITLAIVYHGLKWFKCTNQPRFCRWSVSSEVARHTQACARKRPHHRWCCYSCHNCCCYCYCKCFTLYGGKTKERES